MTTRLWSRQGRKLFTTKIIVGYDVSFYPKLYNKQSYLTPDFLSKKNKRPSKFWKKNGNRKIITKPNCCNEAESQSVREIPVKRNIFNLW